MVFDKKVLLLSQVLILMNLVDMHMKLMLLRLSFAGMFRI